MNGFKREQSVNVPSENGFNMKIFRDSLDHESNDSDSEEVPAKSMRLEEQQETTTDENLFSQDLTIDEPKEFEDDETLEDSNMVNDNESPENMEQCHSNNSAMSNSSSRRKRCLPQRQITTEINGNGDNGISIKDSRIPENVDDVVPDDEGGQSPSPEVVAAENNDEPVVQVPTQNANYFLNVMNMLPPHLNNFGNNGTNRLQEFLEAQRRLQMNNKIGENGQKSATQINNEMPSMEKIPSLAQLHQTQQQDMQQSVFRLCQTLKDEIGTAIDKVVSEYRTRESRAFMERMLRTVAVTNEVQQQMNDMKQHYNNQQQRLAAAAAASFLIPKNVNQMYNSNGPTNAAAAAASSSSFVNPTMSNLLAAAAAANQTTTSSSSSNSIFPAPSHPGLSSFPTLASHLNNSNSMIRSNSAVADCSPIRKKRSKVTDSLRVNKAGIIRDSSNSLPASERSSPLTNSYFPPTMVNHSLYSSSNFGGNVEDRDESGENSDNFSDCGPYDGTYPISNTLTPIHLRKAKLMFFYTRYPSSALLKSFFVDIRFNKGNTAQLVKWFSNFREFFYMQMEKYAKQAIAEGIEHREQIRVTEESEIYKILNQHYNRNNLFPPPPKLREVIEETLREFFVALQQRRDCEPSWKKAIYKVIMRMDDSIPEHFKHPSFMCTLE
uniref:Prospero domain-containing protein n=1 Tax=Panagrolaimus superbus TaxID=310955 RepID=A0A914YYY4_9BILA